MRSEVKVFTIVELLVVVSIISLLAALLLPALNLARQKAKDTSCKNNLRQIGLSLQLYQSDYDGRFPDYGAIGARDASGVEYSKANYRRGLGENDGGGVEEYGMAAALKPYLGDNPNAWICPSSTPLKLSYKNTYAWRAQYFNFLSLSKGMTYKSSAVTNAQLNKIPILFDNISYAPIPTGQFGSASNLPSAAVNETKGPHIQNDLYAKINKPWAGVYALTSAGYVSTYNTVSVQ